MPPPPSPLSRLGLPQFWALPHKQTKSDFLLSAILYLRTNQGLVNFDKNQLSVIPFGCRGGD